MQVRLHSLRVIFYIGTVFKNINIQRRIFDKTTSKSIDLMVQYTLDKKVQERMGLWQDYIL